MKCEQARLLASMDVDGELDDAGKLALGEHMGACPRCREERERWVHIGRTLASLDLARRYDRVLDTFEAHVYARMERGVAWILLSLGSIVLALSGAFYLVRDFLLDASVPLAVRAGVGAGVTGLTILGVSSLRHRLATRGADPYTGVQR